MAIPNEKSPPLGPASFGKQGADVEQLTLSAPAHHLADQMEDFRSHFAAVLLASPHHLAD